MEFFAIADIETNVRSLKNHRHVFDGHVRGVARVLISCTSPQRNPQRDASLEEATIGKKQHVLVGKTFFKSVAGDGVLFTWTLCTLK